MLLYEESYKNIKSKKIIYITYNSDREKMFLRSSNNEKETFRLRAGNNYLIPLKSATRDIRYFSPFVEKLFNEDNMLDETKNTLKVNIKDINGSIWSSDLPIFSVFNYNYNLNPTIIPLTSDFFSTENNRHKKLISKIKNNGEDLDKIRKIKYPFNL